MQTIDTFVYLKLTIVNVKNHCTFFLTGICSLNLWNVESLMLELDNNSELAKFTLRTTKASLGYYVLINIAKTLSSSWNETYIYGRNHYSEFCTAFKFLWFSTNYSHRFFHCQWSGVRIGWNGFKSWYVWKIKYWTWLTDVLHSLLGRVLSVTTPLPLIMNLVHAQKSFNPKNSKARQEIWYAQLKNVSIPYEFWIVLDNI